MHHGDASSLLTQRESIPHTKHCTSWFVRLLGLSGMQEGVDTVASITLFQKQYVMQSIMKDYQLKFLLRSLEAAVN